MNEVYVKATMCFFIAFGVVVGGALLAGAARLLQLSQKISPKNEINPLHNAEFCVFCIFYSCYANVML